MDYYNINNIAIEVEKLGNSTIYDICSMYQIPYVLYESGGDSEAAAISLSIYDYIIYKNENLGKFDEESTEAARIALINHLKTLYYHALFSTKKSFRFENESDYLLFFWHIRLYFAKNLKKYAILDEDTHAAILRFCRNTKYENRNHKSRRGKLINFYSDWYIFNRRVRREGGDSINPYFDACALAHLVFRCECNCEKKN